MLQVICPPLKLKKLLSILTSIKKKAEELNQKTLHNFGRKNHKPNKNGRKRCLPRERRKNRNGYLQEDLSDDGKTSYSIY